MPIRLKNPPTPGTSFTRQVASDTRFDTRDGFTLGLHLDTRLTTVARLEAYREAFDNLRNERVYFEQKLGSLIWDREWYADWGSQILSHYPSNFL